MAKKHSSGMGTGVAIGAGVAALSAAAYLLFGPEGTKHRKDLKHWMVQMKADVMKKMEDAKEISAEKYGDIVSAVEAKYKTMKGVDAAELKKEVAALKKNWHTHMKKHAKKGAKKTAKAAKK